jgi:hypothetical protein
MMLPAATHRVWSEIATGKKPVRSSNLALNLLIKNNHISFGKDPSQANVQLLAAKTHKFFVQYEKFFASEFDKILA